MIKNHLSIKSPIVVTALFVGLCEIGFGILSNNIDIPVIVVSGMVILPFFVYGLFFIIWFWRPHNLYAPTDFKDQKDFLVLHNKITKLEESPFMKYANLEEPAIRLFLSAYYELKNPEQTKSRGQRWSDLVGRFNEDEIKKALDKLVEYHWLSKQETPFSLTDEGRRVHDLLKHFVYGRLG